MKKEVQGRWVNWIMQKLEDEELQREIQEITGKNQEIEDRFYKELEFGTGGLRGIIGVGTNRMNIYTTAKATQGYADYLNRHYIKPSVAIAYDSRIKSDIFARTAAMVFAANGILVHMYRELMPVPSLSFAVRQLECSGGIVITASHNPAEYNGYKVYGSDGCQITMAAAMEIQEEINKLDIFEDVRKLEFEQACREGMVSYIEQAVTDAFIRAVSGEALCQPDMRKDISVVYTPLNGAGRYCVTRVLQENGFMDVSVVGEQEFPDGHFPTCPYPNPEVGEALALGLQFAERLGSDLLLATDPDCDRVGAAVRGPDGYVRLSGNEMGLLLFDYICKRRTESGTMPENPVMLKTIVTADMAKLIAADYGVEVIDLLTGFKFIGEKIGQLEKQGESGRYIFGFEESYGYLTGRYVRDKDAVAGSLLICEMTAYYKNQGKSLLDVLDSLYERYGLWFHTLRSYVFDGAEGFARMKGIMDRLRRTAPGEIAGLRVTGVWDYQDSEVSYLPKSDVLKIMLEGNMSVVLRPSGTEPKLKVYISVSAVKKVDVISLEGWMAADMERIIFG